MSTAPSPATQPTPEQLAAASPYVREAIGPRRVGGRYRSGYWGNEYLVERIALGEEAEALIFWSQWAIVEVDLDGPNKGQRRVHCTAWEHGRDQVVAQPGEQTIPIPAVGSAPTQGDLSTGTSPARGQVAGAELEVAYEPPVPPYTWPQRLLDEARFVLSGLIWWAVVLTVVGFAGAISARLTAWPLQDIDIVVGSGAVVITVIMGWSLIVGLIDGPVVSRLFGREGTEAAR